MRQWLELFTDGAVVVIDFLAAVLIVMGTVEAFVTGLLTWSKTRHEKREVWLRYARWLVAGLSFQLGADIMETAVRTSWTALGQLAAVAAIRTFLDYFLGRDIREVREIEKQSVEGAR